MTVKINTLQIYSNSVAKTALSTSELSSWRKKVHFHGENQNRAFYLAGFTIVFPLGAVNDGVLK